MFSISLTSSAQLRPLDPWQAAEFHEHLGRAREFIRPWVGQSFVATDFESARAVLQRYADNRSRDAGGIFGIWSNETLVGGVMFASFSAAAGVCEAGCWLEPSAVGGGLVTRALTHIIDWAVYSRGITRVEWQTLSENTPSKRVAQRLGMRLDGVMRQAISPRADQSARQDLEIWSILDDEWKAHRNQ